MYAVEEPAILNPFEHRLRISWAQKIQIALMTVTIFPIRAFFLILITTMLCLVTTIATTGLPKVSSAPLKGWRRSMSPLVRFLVRAGFFSLGYHYIKVKGRRNIDVDNIPDIIVAAPHTSFLDVVLIFSIPELASGVSRMENLYIPFIGRICRFFTPITVARTDPESRLNTINEIRQRVLARMKLRNLSKGDLEIQDDVIPVNWPVTMAFPEGTATNGKCLISFKPGAFIPGLPVLPISIRHHNQADSTVWTWVGPGVWKVLWLTMCQLHTSCTMTIFPLYWPSEAEKSNPKLYASSVRDIIARSLKVPIVDFNFFDCNFVVYLSKLNLQPRPQVTSLNRLYMKMNSCKSIQPFIEEVMMITNLSEYISPVRMNQRQFKLYMRFVDNLGQAASFTNKYINIYENESDSSLKDDSTSTANSATSDAAVVAQGVKSKSVTQLKSSSKIITVTEKTPSEAPTPEESVSILYPGGSKLQINLFRIPRNSQLANMPINTDSLTLMTGGEEAGCLQSNSDALFTVLAKQRDGQLKLDLREFMLLFCLCSQPQETDRLVKLAFRLYDDRGERYLAKNEFKEVLVTLFQCSDLEIQQLCDLLFENGDTITYEYFESFCLSKKSLNKLSSPGLRDTMRRFFIPKSGLQKLNMGAIRDVKMTKKMMKLLMMKKKKNMMTTTPLSSSSSSSGSYNKPAINSGDIANYGSVVH
ncbi:hypothetical protein HELRODRAFT_191907 [Helobdella robusta]|uniref:Phospholipid/glycerol acyltransferase domain-containing protein n=1 Tax=Helobdella robusta TaxID=6412 RepID=T1FTE6_HELRO|nr:hypothetical protein HELRODRAFT_191907 [Helobdella robusta]ESO03653.1 hypothetical protein HELRODRAFT_191907 [Helobdella robusta]